MLEAPFFHHARRWQVEDVRLNHEDFISGLFMRLQVDIAEKIFQARQQLQGDVWFASVQSTLETVAIAHHIWNLCEIDKEMWRIKLDWHQSERGCWLDEVHDPNMHWAMPNFPSEPPPEDSVEELP